MHCKLPQFIQRSPICVLQWALQGGGHTNGTKTATTWKQQPIKTKTSLQAALLAATVLSPSKQNQAVSTILAAENNFKAWWWGINKWERIHLMFKQIVQCIPYRWGRPLVYKPQTSFKRNQVNNNGIKARHGTEKGSCTHSASIHPHTLKPFHPGKMPHTKASTELWLWAVGSGLSPHELLLLWPQFRWAFSRRCEFNKCIWEPQRRDLNRWHCLPSAVRRKNDL